MFVKWKQGKTALTFQTTFCINIFFNFNLCQMETTVHLRNQAATELVCAELPISM